MPTSAPGAAYPYNRADVGIGPYGDVCHAEDPHFDPGPVPDQYVLVHDEEHWLCCVIDPGYNAEGILKYVNDHHLRVDAILLTHGHFDHVGAAGKLAELADCEVYMCQRDLLLPEHLTAGSLDYTEELEDCQHIWLADLDFYVVYTPGHTPGSVCLFCQDAMFSGDTLFAGSCGRTDLGGNWNILQNSLRRIASLESDFHVYPGHGEPTTLSREKQYNPFMR